MCRVMPLVRTGCPDARVHLVGRRPSGRVRELAEKFPFVDLREDVDDLGAEYREARCAVIPMRSGSGTNVKLLEALSHGLPVVATSKTVEGVPIRDGEGVRVVDSTEGLAAAALVLLDSPASASELGSRAREVFEEHLSWDAAVDRPLRGALARALESRH